MRKFITLVLLLLFSTSCWAEVQIDQKNLVKNRPPGYCAWCCLEALAKHNNVEKLKHISTDRDQDEDFVHWISPTFGIVEPKYSGSGEACEDKLNKLGVKYKSGYFDRELVKEAVKSKGGMVHMKAGAFGSEGHAIIIVDYTDTDVIFWNPNDCYRYRATREWFDYWWNGYILVLD